MKFTVCLVLFFFSVGCFALPDCTSGRAKLSTNCYGSHTYVDSGKYIGEFMLGKRHGQGTSTYPNGDKFVGSFIHDHMEQGT